MTQPETRQRLSSSVRREQIIQAALRLFRKRPFDTVGMRDLAAACDLSPMGIYRHFANKEALLVGLFDRHCERLRVGMRAALRAEPGLERLTALIEFHVNQVLAEPGLIPIYQREDAGLNAADHERLHVVLRRYAATWTEAISEYRPELSPGMARAIVAAVFGLLNSPAYDYPDLSEDAVRELLTTLVWRVIEPAPPAATPAMKTRKGAKSTPRQ